VFLQEKKREGSPTFISGGEKRRPRGAAAISSKDVERKGKGKESAFAWKKICLDRRSSDSDNPGAEEGGETYGRKEKAALAWQEDLAAVGKL